MNSSTSPWNSE